MQIAIISDTHMPRGPGRRLPDACVERLKAADLIIHAGDSMRLEVLCQIETYNEVVAVYGNVDEAELRAILPERRTLETPEGVRIGIVHDAGPARRRIERLSKWFPDADAVVFGHSHIPLHERAPDGFQIFNPGSPTERRRAPRHTMGMAHTSAATAAPERRAKIAFKLVSLG